MSLTDRDQELLDGLYRGEPKAHEQLVETYGEAIVRFLVAVCRVDQDDAEDVAVETLYRAIERIDRFVYHMDSGPHAFRNWLFTIARNLWRTKMRRNLPSVSMEILENATATQFDPPSPEARIVCAALEQLPEGQRLTLLLHYSGSDLTDVAAVLGVPPGTARQWKRRGLAALSRILRADPALAHLLSPETVSGDRL